jgi:hypothetical protein
MFPSRTWTTTGLLTLWAAEALAQAAPPVLAPFSASAGTTLPAAWRAVGLPQGKAPLAQMDVTPLDGARVLRLQTDKSYGTLIHAVSAWTPGPDASLQWRWRLDTPLAQPDLRSKASDDAALKVCVMYDMPLDGIPFLERNLLRLARSVSGEALPSATVCYVWDATLVRDTVLSNVYSGRVRYIVLDGQGSTLGQWRAHQRNLAADFMRLFRAESKTLPPVSAVAVGADADNTGGHSLAYLSDIQLRP